MKKLGLIGFGLVLVGLMVGISLADTPKEFSLTGSIDAPWAFRDQGINAVHNAAGLPLNVNQKSDFVLAPLITLNTKWDLKDGVTAFVQFENRRLQNNIGTLANAEFGGGVNIEPAVKQAYIKVEDFLAPKLAMTYGIQPVKQTLRKGEGAFFLDVEESLTVSNWMPLDPQVANRAATVRGRTEFSGIGFNYGGAKDDAYAVGFFWGNTRETSVVRANDNLLAITFDYKLAGEDNVVKAIVAKNTRFDINMDVMTIGVGADYFGAMPNKVLEIYGEIYSQSGTLSNGGVTAAGVATDVDQAAQAYRFGAKYNLAHDLKPYVGLCYEFRSGGDDTQTYKGPAAPAKYTENNHFFSYENSQSTMILEDNVYGLDLDSNYTAIKIEAGITTSFNIDREGEPEPVQIKLLVGSFTLNEVPYSDDAATAVLTPVKTDDGLGMEIDITATVQYTENLSFTLGLGMLTGADFFGSVEYRDPEVGNALATQGFDSMTMVMFGANVKF